jgi:hypothetical protein
LEYPLASILSKLRDLKANRSRTKQKSNSCQKYRTAVKVAKLRAEEKKKVQEGTAYMQLECFSHHLIKYMQKNYITNSECLFPKNDFFYIMPIKLIFLFIYST